jgi:hypothetical protein
VAGKNGGNVMKDVLTRIVLPIILGMSIGVGTYIVTKLIDTRSDSQKGVADVINNDPLQDIKINALEYECSKNSEKDKRQDLKILEISVKLDNIEKNTSEIKSDIKELRNIFLDYEYTTTDNRNATLCGN